MWILLVDVFTAGPLGPNAKLFGSAWSCFWPVGDLTHVRGP